MGISVDSARFLVQARRSGVRFDQVLTLGRQHLAVGPERLETILREEGCWPPGGGAEAFHRSVVEALWRFEAFARALGARTVTACDASDYEGASVMHDLNQPVPAEWEERYDLVVDGGTLEHVFNFPVAIANCMRMVKTGGHLILFTTANNYCGHGFYQFSPELFYRVLRAENGFEVIKMIALADSDGVANLLGVHYPFPITGPWYSVEDPARVQSRVTLINDQPTLLYVLARKTAHQPIFASWPQQSDYVTQWNAGTASAPLNQPGGAGGVVGWLRRMFSETFCREMLPRLALVLDPFRCRRFLRGSSFRNRKFYRPVHRQTRCDRSPKSKRTYW